MRKKIKKEIIEIIDSMFEAHRVISKMLEEQKMQGVSALLADCQECAIEVGSIIENQEGKETKAVIRLESYSEELYKFNQAVSIKLSEDTLLLDELLLQARHEIDENISSCLKILFLPYKASMWDSMESVWENAIGDVECEAIVVPVPYFERNKDGSVGKLNCERHLFPQYVSVKPYETFHIDKEQYDIIYIHNPYDASNIVTSIHPDYYSEKLKKYTGMLVYIPYYINIDGITEGMEILPAYYFADRIILQNEDMAEGIHESIAREKLAVLGSPKADRILKLCEKPPDIPKKWQNKIYRTDGTKKKIILYNCSISGLLQNTNEFLDKIEFVFQIAKKNENIILLWRIHPLFEATLKSMRPENHARFIRIKEKFLKDRFGIFDETADPTVSIALSDAYIGESSSSMVTMFGITGKPVFILNTSINNSKDLVLEEEMQSLSFIDMVIDGEEAWFVSNRYQALCKMNMNTGDASIIARIPETEIEFKNSYGNIYKKDDKIYMTPVNTQALCIYDLKIKTFQKLYFPNARNFNNFDDLLFYNDEIVMKPYGYDGLIRYNISSGTYRIIDGFINEYDGLCKNYDVTMPRFSGKIRMIDDVFWLACLQCNYIFEYNLRNDSWLYYKVGAENNTYFDVIFIDSILWMLPYTGNNITKWNSITDESYEYNLALDGLKFNSNNSTALFGSWYYNENYLYAIPFFANNILKINTKNDEMQVQDIDLNLDIRDRLFEHWKALVNYNVIKENEKFLILKLTYDESLLFINKKDMKLKRKLSVRLKKEELVKLQREKLNADMKEHPALYGCWEDKEFISLPIFMDFIANGDIAKFVEQRKFYNKRLVNLGTAGKAIHEYIKAEVSK